MGGRAARAEKDGRVEQDERFGCSGQHRKILCKSVEEGFSEKADIIKDCQAEAKWYGNEELFVVYQAAIRRYNNTCKERDKWCIWGYGRELKRRGLICDNGEY